MESAENKNNEIKFGVEVVFLQFIKILLFGVILIFILNVLFSFESLSNSISLFLLSLDSIFKIKRKYLFRFYILIKFYN